MTILKTELHFRGKKYELMLEDGLVSYIDPANPDYLREIRLKDGQKITSMESARILLIDWLKKLPDPIMTFSD